MYIISPTPPPCQVEFEKILNFLCEFLRRGSGGRRRVERRPGGDVRAESGRSLPAAQKEARTEAEPVRRLGAAFRRGKTRAGGVRAQSGRRPSVIRCWGKGSPGRRGPRPSEGRAQPVGGTKESPNGGIRGGLTLHHDFRHDGQKIGRGGLAYAVNSDPRSALLPRLPTPGQ